MTAEEYESILCPTAADFAAWTKSFFARAQAVLDRVDAKWPNLGRNKRCNYATDANDPDLWELGEVC